ncbi:hypothetical protein PYK79_39295 [Streptomyces sp. ID05-04B]|nr:hypothetical protein [Streptomyces sp. ID05-04B]
MRARAANPRESHQVAGGAGEFAGARQRVVRSATEARVAVDVQQRPLDAALRVTDLRSARALDGCGRDCWRT